jgi:hypothetical protein
MSRIVRVCREVHGILLLAIPVGIVIIEQIAGLNGSIVSSVMEGNARRIFVAAISSNEHASIVSSLTEGRIGEWKLSSSYKVSDSRCGSTRSDSAR